MKRKQSYNKGLLLSIANWLEHSGSMNINNIGIANWLEHSGSMNINNIGIANWLEMEGDGGRKGCSAWQQDRGEV